MPEDTPPDPPAPARHRWVLARAAAALWRRFRADWRSLPVPSWHRFLWILAGGFVPGAALTLGLCGVARRMERTGALAWEAGVLRDIEARGPLPFSWAIWAETPGNSVFMIPAVLAFAVAIAMHGLPLRALAVLASFFMLDLLVLLGWTVWNRARPDVIAGGLASPGLHSFPSGHLAQIVSSYGLLVYLWARDSRSLLERALAVLLLLAMIGLVSLARLRLGSHWPSDLVAGVMIGALWLIVVVTALRRAEAAGGR